MQRDKSERIHFRASKDDKNRYQKLADRLKVSLSEFIRKALDREVERNEGENEK